MRTSLRLSRPFTALQRLPSALFRPFAALQRLPSALLARPMTGLSVLAQLNEPRAPAAFGDDGGAALWVDASTANGISLRHEPERKLCDLGTGEQMEVLAFHAQPGHEDEFERVVQRLVLELHDAEAGVSDMRVMHPRCGEATFVVTLLSKKEAHRFAQHLRPRIVGALAGVSAEGGPAYSGRGSLMPPAHSLASLLDALAARLRGSTHSDQHDVRAVSAEIARWFPRRQEYGGFAKTDPSDPARYTRNVLYSTPEMEVLLMCWPAGARSTIHCHDESSCWVALVEGEKIPGARGPVRPANA